MKYSIVVLLFLFWYTGSLRAQQYLLSSSRWTDVNTKSVRKTPSTIAIDSSMITISQGETNLYLEIKKQQRDGTTFSYVLLDPYDKETRAVFSPEQMTFDYQAGEFHLKYLIDKIERPDKEKTDQQEIVKDTSAAKQDTAAVKEDTKIYETADVMPEFPGGKEAMTQWLASNVKYPAAAKKAGLVGLVTVSAVVEKNGTLSEVTVKRDIGGGCGAEAVRAIQLMPTWIPGQVKNEDKRVRVTISVFFPPN
jgi:TonB family protein